MACIRKIDSDITFDCASLGAVSGTGEIDEAIIINSSDIATVSETGSVGTITMQTGKKGYVINSVNNSIMYQDAIKVSDILPPGEDQSVIIKVLRSPGSLGGYREVISRLIGGNYRVAAKTKSGEYFLAGAFCGLEASDLATDSSTGGVSTVTLKTPEGATGDKLVSLTKATYDGLKIPKV